MKRLLLVDDALRARLQLREILDTRSDWRVQEARSGEVALALLEGLEPPQACIFGVGVSDGSGADLLLRIRAAGVDGTGRPALRRMPILLSVPAEEAEAVAAATGLDAAFIVTRPFDPPRVVAAVERALDQG